MTTYVVVVRYASGMEASHSFDSMLGRALFVIGLTPFTTVVREYEASR